MRLGLNLIAGLANSSWSALVSLAVVPLYIKYLGIEAYGLIGFFATTQALLQLLDLGLAPTINREVARCSAQGDLRQSGKLLHTLAVVYWAMAGGIALLIFVLAPLISQHWLQSKELSAESISHAVMLMGLVVASRWPIGLYQGALIGAQRLTISSGINVVMVTVGALGAVAVLAFVSATIEAFFIWQACVGLALVMLMRFAAWRIIGKDISYKYKFGVDDLKKVWRFSAGMSGVAISGIILMQLDKILLSRILSLEDFGRYTLAGVIASGLYIILTPTFNVIYPRLTALVASEDEKEVAYFYRTGTRLLTAIIFPLAAVVAVFSKEIISVWTGNQTLAASAAPIASLFLIGTALNGAMHFPYALQLAYGAVRLPLKINMILVVFMIPIILFLAIHYGAEGGAAAWAILNGIYVLIGTVLTHRTLLKGEGGRWLFSGVGVPLGLSLLLVGGLGMAIQRQGYSYFMDLLAGILLVLFAFFVIIFSSGQLRKDVMSLYRQKLMMNTTNSGI